MQTNRRSVSLNGNPKPAGISRAHATGGRQALASQSRQRESMGEGPERARAAQDGAHPADHGRSLEGPGTTGITSTLSIFFALIPHNLANFESIGCRFLFQVLQVFLPIFSGREEQMLKDAVKENPGRYENLMSSRDAKVNAKKKKPLNAMRTSCRPG